MSKQIADFSEWIDRPSLMVRDLFGVDPDPWQEEALDAFPKSPRLAFKACKGPGKTSVLAWLAWNFLLTRPRPKIGAISITAQNLADGLWAEMTKWQAKSELLKSLFTCQKTRIFANSDPNNWFMVAKSFSVSADREEQAKALAGFHEDYILFLIDESGGMPDAVMVSAEAALSSCVEGHIVQAGNPTNLDGPLYRACTTAKHLWRVIEITGDPDDPKRSPRINKEYAREQIKQYGRDNPWVLVNIFGQFPPSSLNALIGPDEVYAAFKRSWREHEIGHAPRILGVDVARFGADESVIFPRWGIQAFQPLKHRNLDSLQGASIVSRKWEEFKADACFIDDTGGFGSGWIDNLRSLGRAPIGVHFSKKADQSARYFNKRSEMYFRAVQWIRDGGALVASDELLRALTTTTYTITGDALQLEPKDAVKGRLGFSPDEADAFALTFAHEVTAGSARRKRVNYSALGSGYDPFGGMNDNAGYDYDPWRETVR